MDYKISEIVDKKALEEVEALRTELGSLKDSYVSLAQQLSAKLGVDVSSLKEFKKELGDINSMMVTLSQTEVKITTTQEKYSDSVEKVVRQMEKKVQVQQKNQQVTAQTTNTISRELAEIEKENAKKRESFELDKTALDITEQILGSRKANTQSLAEYQQTLASLKETKKEIDDLEKQGIITSEEALMRRTDLLEAERSTKAAMQETQTVLKNQEKLAMDASGSYTELSHQLELMKKAYKQLNEEEKAGEQGQTLNKQIQALDAHLKDLAADMGEFQRNVGNYAIANGSMKKEVADLSTKLAELIVEYRALSDEEKKSEAGLALAQQMEDIRSRAGDMKDAIMDARQAIQGTASDTKGLDSVAGQLGIVAAGFAAATAAGKMFGVEEEELTQIQASVVAVLGLANNAKQIQNALQKQSNVMIGIATVQHAAETKAIALKTAAEGKGVIATKAATVAQAAFNLVAKANPYVLLAGAVVTVVGALAAFALGAKKAKDEVAATNRELEQMDGLMKRLRDDSNFEIEIARAAGASTEKLRKMKEEAAQAELALARLNQSKTFDLYIREKVSEDDWKKAQQAVIDAQDNLREVQRRNRVEVVAEETKANQDRLKAQEDAAKARIDAQKRAQEESAKAAEEHAKYMADIDKQLAQSQIDLMSGKDKDIAEIKAKYKERYDAIKGSTDKEIALRENLAKLEEGELAEVERKYLEESAKAQEEASERKIEAIEKEIERRSDLLNGMFVADMLALKKALADNEITEKEYNERLTNLRNDYAADTAGGTVAYLKDILANEKLTQEEREKLEKDFAEAFAEMEDARLDKTIDVNKKLKESHKENLRAVSDMIGGVTDMVNAFAGLGEELYQGQIDKINEMLDELDLRYDEEVAKIEELESNGSIATEEAEARKRAALDRTDRERAKLLKRQQEDERKQARLSKASAIATATMNIAQSVLQVLANPGNGPTWARIAQIAMVSAIGAANLATIMATPIAAYAKGTKDHPGGKAIVGDGGRQEVVLMNGKAWITPSVPTLIDLPKHAQVFPDVESFKKMKPMIGYTSIGANGEVKVISDFSTLQKSMENGNSQSAKQTKILQQIANNQRNMGFESYIRSKF